MNRQQICEKFTTTNLEKGFTNGMDCEREQIVSTLSVSEL